MSMHVFVPRPKHGTQWWRKQKVVSILAGGVEGKFDKLSADSWIVGGNYTSEFMAPLPGYPVIFPTATDCLLWLRWQVLPASCAAEGLDFLTTEVELTGEILRLADRIDQAPSGSSSAGLLEELGDTFRFECEGADHWFNIISIGSVDEFLDDQDLPLRTWKKLLESRSIRREQGVWSMSRRSWKALTEELLIENIQCSISSRGLDSEDEGKDG